MRLTTGMRVGGALVTLLAGHFLVNQQMNVASGLTDVFQRTRQEHNLEHEMRSMDGKLSGKPLFDHYVHAFHVFMTHGPFGMFDAISNALLAVKAYTKIVLKEPEFYFTLAGVYLMGLRPDKAVTWAFRQIGNSLKPGGLLREAGRGLGQMFGWMWSKVSGAAIGQTLVKGGPSTAIGLGLLAFLGLTYKNVASGQQQQNFFAEYTQMGGH